MEYFSPRQPSTNVHLTLVKTWLHALNLRTITSATAHKDSKEKLVKVRSSIRVTVGIYPTKSKLRRSLLMRQRSLIFIEFDNVGMEMTATKSAKKIMCGMFKCLVCFFNLLSLISVQDVVAVVARTRQYRFPANNSLRATISLKSRR